MAIFFIRFIYQREQPQKRLPHHMKKAMTALAVLLFLAAPAAVMADTAPADEYLQNMPPDEEGWADVEDDPTAGAAPMTGDDAEASPADADDE